MAGRLRHHPSWTAAHLADDLAADQDRLAEMHAEDATVSAAFDLSLPGSARRPAAAVPPPGPAPDLDAYAAAALDGTDLAHTRHGLDALFTRTTSSTNRPAGVTDPDGWRPWPAGAGLAR